MGLIIIFLILAIIFAGVGFAIHVLWIIAVICFLLWLISLFLGRRGRV